MRSEAPCPVLPGVSLAMWPGTPGLGRWVSGFSISADPELGTLPFTSAKIQAFAGISSLPASLFTSQVETELVVTETKPSRGKVLPPTQKSGCVSPIKVSILQGGPSHPQTQA